MFGLLPNFAAAHDALWFPAALLRRPSRNANPGLHRLLWQHAQAQLAELVENDLLNRLSYLLGVRLGQADCSLRACADELGMTAAALGIDNLQVTSNPLANNAIRTIDKAIGLVSGERAKLGAVQNRLDHTINSLGASYENLVAAESRIRDVDMAKQMMEFTKYNILSQAATAMMAQANQLPQSVLQLLR